MLAENCLRKRGNSKTPEIGSLLERLERDRHGYRIPRRALEAFMAGEGLGGRQPVDKQTEGGRLRRCVVAILVPTKKYL